MSEKCNLRFRRPGIEVGLIKPFFLENLLFNFCGQIQYLFFISGCKVKFSRSIIKRIYKKNNNAPKYLSKVYFPEIFLHR